MRRGATGGALLVLAFATCSWGYSFLDLGLGSKVFQGSARCGGMGEVALLCEDSPLAVVGNPASLAMFRRPEVIASYRFLSFEEDWSFPAHDSFDAILGYNTYSRNSNLYHSGAVAVASGAVPQALGVSVGFAVAPAYDFSYDFYEEIRDRSTSSVPTDKVIANGFIESEGDILSLSFGAGKSLREDLSVGVSVDYLFGDFDLEARLSSVDTTKVHCWESPGTETSDSFRSSNLSGMRYRVGARYRLNMRVEMAACATSGCDLEGDYSTTSTDGLLGFLPRESEEGGSFMLKYPASYTLGIAFKPRNELLTVIEANVTYTRWSDAANEALDDLRLEDTYTWHIGIEHVFYNQQPLRLGFVYADSPTEEQTSEAALTVGSGIMFRGFAIEAAGKVGWREYRHAVVFDDSIFCAQSRDLADLVEETSFSGMISVTRRL